MENLRSLPRDSRVWIFTLDREISGDELKNLQKMLGEFVASWKAHGKPVRAGVEITYGRFVVVAADSSASEVSGCSIDSMYRSAKDLAQKSGAGLLDIGDIVFREDGIIRCMPRLEFSEYVRNQRVNGSTIVFDNLVQTLGDYANGKWEIPFASAWHARAFGM